MARVEQAEAAIERGSLRFTPHRIEKLRNGKLVTAVSRKDARAIVVRTVGASEHPVRELLWAIGAGLGACVACWSALDSGAASAWLVAAFLTLISALLIKHQFSTVTVLEVKTRNGDGRLDFEERLEQEHCQPEPPARKGARLAGDRRVTEPPLEPTCAHAAER